MAEKTLFVTDLDGTFVQDSKIVASEDLAGYSELQSLGEFAIATGRSLKEIYYIRDTYQLDPAYLIAFNGALIESHGTRCFAQPIEQEDRVQLLTFLEREGLTFDALDNEIRLGNYWTEEVDRLWGMDLIYRERPFEELADKTIYKVNIRPKRGEGPGYLEMLRREFPHLEIFESGATRIEVTAKGVSKGSGLALIQPHYQTIVSFGDSGNDVALFAASDVSYCMQHAPAYVQASATHVVSSFAQAVAHYQQQYRAQAG